MLSKCTSLCQASSPGPALGTQGGEDFCCAWQPCLVVGISKSGQLGWWGGVGKVLQGLSTQGHFLARGLLRPEPGGQTLCGGVPAPNLTGEGVLERVSYRLRDNPGF